MFTKSYFGVDYAGQTRIKESMSETVFYTKHCLSEGIARGTIEELDPPAPYVRFRWDNPARSEVASRSQLFTSLESAIKCAEKKREKRRKVIQRQLTELDAIVFQ